MGQKQNHFNSSGHCLFQSRDSGSGRNKVRRQLSTETAPSPDLVLECLSGNRRQEQLKAFSYCQQGVKPFLY